MIKSAVKEAWNTVLYWANDGLKKILSSFASPPKWLKLFADVLAIVLDGIAIWNTITNVRDVVNLVSNKSFTANLENIGNVLIKYAHGSKPSAINAAAIAGVKGGAITQLGNFSTIFGDINNFWYDANSDSMS